MRIRCHFSRTNRWLELVSLISRHPILHLLHNPNMVRHTVLWGPVEEDEHSRPPGCRTPCRLGICSVSCFRACLCRTRFWTAAFRAASCCAVEAGAETAIDCSRVRIGLWAVRGDRASALSRTPPVVCACCRRMILSTAAFRPASCCEELVKFLPASVVFSWLRVRTGLFNSSFVIKINFLSALRIEKAPASEQMLPQL